MQPGSQDESQSLGYPDVKGCYPSENADILKKEGPIRSRADLRDKAFRRDRFKCAHCGKSFCTKEHVNDFFKKEHVKSQGKSIFDFSRDEHGEYFLVGLPSELIADHIKPLALGGDEWDINNIQTLCSKCNREKTAEDFRRIKSLKASERQISGAEIAARVRQLRGLDMTQKELSKKLGISQSMLSKYENGKSSLTLEIAARYSQIFKKGLDYIAFGKGG